MLCKLSRIFYPRGVRGYCKQQIAVKANSKQEANIEAHFEAFLSATIAERSESKAATETKVDQKLSSTQHNRFHWRTAAHVLRTHSTSSDLLWNIDSKSFQSQPTPDGRYTAIKLPRILPVPNVESAQQYLHTITDHKGRTKLGDTLMVLLSADSAALGIWERDVLRKHKIFTAYTVRKSRGSNQAKYLRSGGPGRSPGGRMRVREAARLFNDAAAKLDLWKANIASCDQAFMSGDVRAFNALYASDVPPPIERRDPRWQRAGVSIPRPRLDDLHYLFKSLSYGTFEELRQMPLND